VRNRGYGTERRRQRPKDAEKQALPYSCKRKAHTDENPVVASAAEWILFLSGTYPGTVCDKRTAEAEQLTYPPGTTLYKDSGFQQRKRKQGVEKKKCTRTGDSALYYVRTA